MYRQDATYFPLTKNQTNRVYQAFIFALAAVLLSTVMDFGLLLWGMGIEATGILLLISILITAVNAKNLFDILRSYVVTSPEGIEYHGAVYTVFSSWEDVGEIALKKSWRGEFPFLKFNPPYKTIPPVFADLPGRSFWMSPDVPLKAFSEGKDSPLMQEIYKYRPDLKG